MPLTFEPLSLKKQAAYNEIFNLCPQKASDYSFVNIWGWCEQYGLEWAWSDGHVWLRQTHPKTVYWAPVGSWDTVDWPHLLTVNFEKPAVFIRVPENLGLLWEATLGDRVDLSQTRDHWDYLYDRQALEDLKGNRFHKKKNLVNQFRKKYDFEYLPLSPGIIDQALGLQDNWCTWRDCEASATLSAENSAIEKVLSNWQSLPGIFGGALMVNGKMASYTVAEALGEDTLVIHFEKGDPDYKGVYQAINQMFLAHMSEAFTLVNREQDLGDEGLRKAKQSYHPVGYLKKVQVNLAG